LLVVQFLNLCVPCDRDPKNTWVALVEDIKPGPH
jgi:hypothetical protein